MITNVHTEWGELKEIIVGSVSNFNDYCADESFYFYFLENLNPGIEKKILERSLKIKKKFLNEREEDLNNLASILTTLGIKVHRPESPPVGVKFKLNTFSDYYSPCDNPRDLVLIVGNRIIETPVGWRRRYFETDLLKKIFINYSNEGSHWTAAPRGILNNDSYDTNSNYKNFNIAHAQLNNSYEMLFDAAQCLKFGKDIVMNVANINHYKGYLWLKKELGCKYNIHPITITDHHIDGMFIPLKPGVLLINSKTMSNNLHKLPKPLQKWEMIRCDEHKQKRTDNTCMLASANISVNVLPVSEKKALIFSETGNECGILKDKLEKYDIEAHEIMFRHSRVFGGGLHCATLDTRRDDDLSSFF